MLIFSYDKPRLLRHFQKDTVLFSYHIGDLDDFYFDDCQWACWYEGTAHIEECLLVYSGGETPTVLSFGVTENYAKLLEQMLNLLPDKFYCHYQNPHLKFLENKFSYTSLGSHIKMKLGQFNRIENKRDEIIIRLDSSYRDELRIFYDESYPDNYFNDRMLETGQYYAVIMDNEIVSVSGVHVYSEKYKIAVLGNITTRPDYRNRGLSTRVTSELLANLDLDNMTVCLNVKSGNEAAIKSYQKLGFAKACRYDEGLFEAKG